MTDLASAEADLDLRLVRYFAVVAGHRHFGRAAAELRIAQPSLSRQVRQLEAQVGARLLDRDRQGTWSALTPLGPESELPLSLDPAICSAALGCARPQQASFACSKHRAGAGVGSEVIFLRLFVDDMSLLG